MSSLRCVVLAQRLTRRLCSACRQPYTPTREELAEVGISISDLTGPIYRPKSGGCPSCLGTGYRGRVGIYELLNVSEKIRAQVVQNLSSSVIRNTAVDEGMSTLRMDGGRKVVQGLTSLEEVMRITQNDDYNLEGL